MTPRKKRWRYMVAARRIAKEQGEELHDGDWEKAWSLLDKFGIPVFTYAMRDSERKLVKIGKSYNPQARLKTLRIGNAGNLKLLGYCKQKEPLTEKNIHNLLSEFRVSGEWFTDCSEVQQIVSEIRRASYVNE